MLVLLLIEADTISKEKYYKTDIVRSFCSSGGKIVLAFLTEVVKSHIVITPINIGKVCFEKIFMRAFCNCESSFYY